MIQSLYDGSFVTSTWTVSLILILTFHQKQNAKDSLDFQTGNKLQMVKNSVPNGDNTFYALKCKPGLFFIQAYCDPAVGKNFISITMTKCIIDFDLC